MGGLYFFAGLVLGALLATVAINFLGVKQPPVPCVEPSLATSSLSQMEPSVALAQSESQPTPVPLSDTSAMTQPLPAAAFTDTTNTRSAVLTINKQQYTFLFRAGEEGVHLATEFCQKMASSLSVAEEHCIVQMRGALDAELAKTPQPASPVELPVDAQTGGAESGGEGARQLSLKVNDVWYVFEYHSDMTAEYASPRLATQFCYSDKGRQTVAPLSAENQLLPAVERESLERLELDARCVAPLTAALLEEISKLV